MKIRCVWEHNGSDSLLYAVNFIGAFTRGASQEEAVRKMPEEIRRFQLWKGDLPIDDCDIEIVQEKESALQVKDADSDVLFRTEEMPLSPEEYRYLKSVAMKSAEDFHALYASFPDKNRSANPTRKTFYGAVPRTAEEMYQHTKNVNAYYFSEIGVDADNEGTIVSCRARGFDALEAVPGFLSLEAVTGSYDERWSVRKVLRRFIWHDRIHAKAMYRMGILTFGADAIPDVFGFDRSIPACREIDKSNYVEADMGEYQFITLRERPEMKNAAAEWFHSKWGVPAEAYLACMDSYLNQETEYGWYLCMDGEQIVAGMGVIENDFHDRKDLKPNVCAVYTDEKYRGKGIAGKLLNMTVEGLKTKGITPVYLVTDHTGFYERYGWEFLCMVQGDGEPEMTRMYIHR